MKQLKNRRKRVLSSILTLFLLLLLSLTACSAGQVPLQETKTEVPADALIVNEAEVVDGIRQGLKEHAATITVRFSLSQELEGSPAQIVSDWVEKALEETDAPDEGDYIRYQYGGYTFESYTSQENGIYRYRVVLTPEYYDWLFEAEEASAKAQETVSGFGFDPDTDDLTKIETVYRFVCETIRYDKVHKKNPYYHLKSTAYSALVQHTATCQGFCTALYRLLRESGISCRIVTGQTKEEGPEELHSWVIVPLDGLWYALDPAWDAGKDEWQWFLKGSESLQERMPSEAFSADEFRTRFPMAVQDYGSI